MNITKWLLALGVLLASTSAWGQDVDESEDPFADEDRDEDEGDSEDGEKDRDDGDGDGDGDGDEGSEEDEYIDEEVRTFGRSGEVVIAAERLAGIARTWRRIEIDGAPDDKSNTTHLHALMNAGGQDFIGFSAPRVGFDVFLSDGLSLGGVLGYSSLSGPYDNRQFTAGLRFGYALMFGKVVGAWGRAGLTFQDHQANVPDSDLPGAQVDAKLTLLAASADVALAVVPAKHLVVLAGPRLDVGFLGKFDRDRAEKVDTTATELGFSASFGIFF